MLEDQPNAQGWGHQSPRTGERFQAKNQFWGQSDQLTHRTDAKNYQVDRPKGETNGIPKKWQELFVHPFVQTYLRH